MVKCNIAISALFAALMLGGLGLTAFATDNAQVIAAASAPGEITDAILTDKVETILHTDLGLAGSQFRVLSKSGVVTIAGSVPDEHSLRRVLDLVSGVRGVREVRNALEINSPK